MEASSSVPDNREPTPSEAMAIARQALEAAEKANSAAEARTSIEQTVAEEAEAQGLSISEEEAKMIAATTITLLEERGAFGQQPSAEPLQDSPSPAAEQAGEPAAEQPAPAEQQPAPGEGEEPPRKKTLAERFQGL